MYKLFSLWPNTCLNTDLMEILFIKCGFRRQIITSWQTNFPKSLWCLSSIIFQVCGIFFVNLLFNVKSGIFVITTHYMQIHVYMIVYTGISDSYVFVMTLNVCYTTVGILNTLTHWWQCFIMTQTPLVTAHCTYSPSPLLSITIYVLFLSLLLYNSLTFTILNYARPDVLHMYLQIIHPIINAYLIQVYTLFISITLHLYIMKLFITLTVASQQSHTFTLYYNSIAYFLHSIPNTDN